MTALEHNLKNIFLEKWKREQLGHFYILHNNSKTGSIQELNDWTRELVRTLVTFDKPGLSANYLENFWELGHPDVLWIEATEKAYSHLDESFQEFFQACEFKPLELKRKIVVIEQCSMLSQTLANKMLKTLEDSTEHMLFIFLNPGDKSILPTIKSRSISLSVITNTSTRSYEKPNDFAQWIENFPIMQGDEDFLANFETVKIALIELSNQSLSLSRFLDIFKGNKVNENLIFEILSAWMAAQAKDYRQAIRSQEAINWWQEQKTFNNASASRLENLIQSSFR